ncbi:PEP-CTERM sorting domain-containing protein [Ruficoccus sp. ZRK36]|uniref:PEP-CTERM sorting domain-containing protein n=1 Tax=Ruficoccus sp. ZRK36 TaxID=2866311 RepID=UPI001C72AEFA|nr:PEP-CTERM sorting domain-containing protein [Ruficoccus sp. ZRK36]QYY36048.1 PEP-CTERM sorting domain-containing protein [Ruficoccus sp. ZRK36]
MNRYCPKLTALMISAGFAGCLPLTSSAEVLYFENFESYTPGSTITTASAYWSSDYTGNDIYFEARDDSSDLFGSSGNQYGYLADTSVTNNQSFSEAITPFTGTQTGQLDFSFYDPSGDLFNGQGFLVRIGSGNGNKKTSFGLFVMDGELVWASGNGVWLNTSQTTTYAMDTANTVSVVFNNSNDPLTYGDQTVASHCMDVYLNGVLVGDDWGGAGEDPTGTAIANVNFTAKSQESSATDFAGTIYLDDIRVDSSINIPEPSSSAMLFASLGGALFVLIKRLRRARA